MNDQILPELNNLNWLWLNDRARFTLEQKFRRNALKRTIASRKRRINIKERQESCVSLINDLLQMNLTTLSLMKTRQQTKEAKQIQKSLLQFQAKCHRLSKIGK